VKQAEQRIVIKQYGIQRSGTNYLEKLVKLNFSPRQALYLTNQFQCKHHAIDPAVAREWLADNPRMEFLAADLPTMAHTINVRDPMSWSLGFLKHRIKIGKPAGKLKEPEAHIAQLVHLNRIYKNWRDYAEKHPERFLVIRFEDLLTDFTMPLREMAMKFSLTTRDLELHDVPQEVMSGGRMSKAIFDRREYYAKKQYLKELTTRVRLAIEDTVDWEIASYFGYVPEED